jgi:hypothetical protein
MEHGQKVSRKRRDLIDALNTLIISKGCWLVSAPSEVQCLRIEAPKGSELPPMLSAKGWNIVHTGTAERLMTIGVEQVKDDKGKVIRTVSQHGPGIVEVFILTLAPDGRSS